MQKIELLERKLDSFVPTAGNFLEKYQKKKIFKIFFLQKEPEFLSIPPWTAATLLKIIPATTRQPRMIIIIIIIII